MKIKGMNVKGFKGFWTNFKQPEQILKIDYH